MLAGVPLPPTPDTLGRLKATDLAVVKFSARWCGPCHAIAPAFEELRDELRKDEASAYRNADFLTVDIDREPLMCDRYNVQAVPLFLVLRHGLEVGRVVGANLPQLRALLKQPPPGGAAPAADPGTRPA